MPSYHPPEHADPRSPPPLTVREWLAKLTGIDIPPLVELPTPAKADVVYGELGDHRWTELASVESVPVVAPARQEIYPAIRNGIQMLEAQSPFELPSLSGTFPTQMEHARRELAAGRPVLASHPVPRSFSHLNLNPFNPMAGYLASPETKVALYEGRWGNINLHPAFYSTTWRQFLALTVHPGALKWTQVPALGWADRPPLVAVLDSSAQALVAAFDMTFVAPVSVKSWYAQRVIYLPFAARIHRTVAPQYRWQLTGHHLVYALQWLDPTNVTQAAMDYRYNMAQQHQWAECLFAGSRLDDSPRTPVSSWIKVITNPGDFIMWPPGTLIIEYSSGASVVTEGSFLPWACVPILKALSYYPDLYVLAALLLLGDSDIKHGRATAEQVKALASILQGHRIAWPDSSAPWSKVTKAFNRNVATKAQKHWK